MTREAEIEQLSSELFDLWAKNGLSFGQIVEKAVIWADAHQPSTWISVEDRLPEEGDLVLAMSETKNDSGIIFRGFSASKYTGGKFINENSYSFYDNTGVFFKMDNKMVLFNITHWMPLPTNN